MKLMYHALAILCLCAVWQGNLEACTGIKLVAEDGSFVHGRTLEFGIQVETSATVIPRGYEFTSATQNGPGLKYKTKYGVLGASAFSNPVIMDGLNEKGLAAGIFYFPSFAGYTQLTEENQSKALAPVDFVNWILTQFQSVDEVKEALSDVVIVPTVDKSWGTEAAPFHYIVYDKKGGCLVIEPIDGKLVTYDNSLGVFTNSPSFDWHMTNLRNYINLSPENAKAVKLAGIELAPMGQGSGLLGMPGDFMPPSRFVRATVFSQTAIPSATAEKGIFQAFHILNQFDIPIGVAREEDSRGITHSDYTQITCVRDPQALKFYFKTYDDQSIKVIDLNKFDLNSKAIKSAATKGATKVIDMTSALK